MGGRVGEKRRGLPNLTSFRLNEIHSGIMLLIRNRITASRPWNPISPNPNCTRLREMVILENDCFMDETYLNLVIKSKTTSILTRKNCLSDWIPMTVPEGI